MRAVHFDTYVMFFPAFLQKSLQFTYVLWEDKPVESLTIAS